jgi:Tfp pilus assembly pilus retraction ATPase PilT
MVFDMAGMYSMRDLLNLVAREGADELHLEPGRPPVMVLQGKRRVIDGTLVTNDHVAELFKGIATEDQKQELDRCGTSHFAFAAPNSARFLIGATLQGASLRLSIKNLGH